VREPPRVPNVATMRVTVFSTQPYDRRFLDAENAAHGHELTYLEARLEPRTAILARSTDAVCAFVNDRLDAEALAQLATGGTRFVALRCAGFNNVDLDAAAHLGISVCRVPAYSPHGVAEHTVALVLTLARRTHKAYARVREMNFSLEGLLGFELHGRTVGIVGTGQIGAAFARIMLGFGCRVLAHDPRRMAALEALGVEYVERDRLYAESDIVSLHCPLTPETHHLVGARSLALMKRGAMLVNTGRGALIDTMAVIEALKSGHLGALALDVYEQEADLFFRDLSQEVLQDDVIARLLTFPNVLVTGHQAFFTEEALGEIARTTLQNLTDLARTGRCANAVGAERIRPAPSPDQLR
jgi:D-lactate dehydrogenase